MINTRPKTTFDKITIKKSRFVSEDQKIFGFKKKILFEKIFQKRILNKIVQYFEPAALLFWVFCFFLPLNSLVDLSSVNRYIPGSGYSKTNLVSADINYCDLYIITNYNRFIFLSTQHQHFQLLLGVGLMPLIVYD